MKKFILPAIVVLVGIITIFVFFMQNSEEKEENQQTEKQTKEKLIIGTEGAYPPFSMINESGDLVGFDIDIANAICEELAIECEIIAYNWDGLIPALLVRKIDAIVASMSITEERKKKIDFTNKYYSSTASFFAHKDKGFSLSYTIEENIDTLKGKVVGAQKETVGEYFLKDNYGDYVEIKSYDTQDALKADLVAGRTDLIIGDTIGFNYNFIKTQVGKDFEIVSPGFSDTKWFGEGIGIGIRKEDVSIKEKINKAIITLRENGIYESIESKYFDYSIYGEEE